LKGNIEIRLVGHVDEEYKQKIKELGLNKSFTLTGHLPHIKSMEHILASDLLLLINPDMDTDGDTFLPSKLSEYIRAEKPILAITPTGATSELIEHYNLGSTAEHNDIIGISEALGIFINKEKSKNLKYSKQLLDDFNREKLVKRIAEKILQKI
jgi:glycosyltransferase involved in cell wall biosynthesis